MLHTSPTRAEKLGPCGLTEESVDDSVIRSSKSVPFVVFDADRLSSSKQRKQFFEEEGFNHEVQFASLPFKNLARINCVEIGS